MIKPTRLFIVLWCFSSLPGCLTVGQKEYRIRFLSETSGRASIRFIDIGSETDDTSDVARQDFQHLIEFYLEGTQFEMGNPGFRNPRKSLYEQNGVLCGEIEFEFDSLETIRLFRFQNTGPYMYYMGSESLSEDLVETNGSYGGDEMPVIFWPEGTDEIHIRTRISTETPSRKSLLSHFKSWQESHRKAAPARVED
jgi:hypothetical protein